MPRLGRDIMSCLSALWNWETRPTLWGAVQALGVPAALFVAIWQPRAALAQARLEDLVAYRNMAWYLVRWMPQVKCTSSQWQSEGYECSVFAACLKITQGIPLDKVHPPAMTNRLSRVQVQGEIAYGLIKKDLPDWAEFRKEENMCQDALNRIDGYLLESRCTFDHEQIAHPPKRRAWLSRSQTRSNERLPTG